MADKLDKSTKKLLEKVAKAINREVNYDFEVTAKDLEEAVKKRKGKQRNE